jgi:DNA-binding response OmpR family regulator
MPGAINIAIIEDEKVQAELLKRYVENWACKKDIPAVTETFYSAESFEFCWSMDKKYNIILLDIQMKGQNGIDLAKRIRQKDDILNIIFVTALRTI